MLRNRLGFSDVGNDLETLTGLRYALQAQHFDWRCRPSFSDRLAAIVEHRAHAAGYLDDDERIVSAKSSLLDQHRRHRATSTIEFCFKHDAGSQTSRARAQIQNV